MAFFIPIEGRRNARQPKIASPEEGIAGGGRFSQLVPTPLLRLEDRQLLSSFTVTRTGIDGSTGTLLWAINQVNADTGPFPDTIDFNIPGTGPFTIQPDEQLPTINNPVIINGYSEPDSSPNAASVPRATMP